MSYDKATGTGSGLGAIPRRPRFAIASPLEGGGFEPSVPHQIRSLFETARPVSHHGSISRPGTDGSNPLPSSGESTNHRFRRRFHRPRLQGALPSSQRLLAGDSQVTVI